MPRPRSQGGVRNGKAGKRGRPTDTAIEAFLDEEGFRWLDVDNVIGITVAEKLRGGAQTGDLAVVFDVQVKLATNADIAKAGSRPIPGALRVGKHLLPTDVVEAWPEAHSEHSPDPHGVHDPISGGISVGNASETGTLGAVVWDRLRGAPVALSNWHVLDVGTGGGMVYQPGPRHASGAGLSAMGRLPRSGILDRKVDGAIATIEFRAAGAEIAGIGTGVRSIAAPRAGQRVVKSGAVTGVTFGVVTNPHKLVSLRVPGRPANHNISVCVIEADAARPARRISDAGDSGSCWMLVGDDDRATGTMVGLHVGGDGPAKAYACHSARIFDALGLEPLPAEMLGIKSSLSVSADPLFALGLEQPGIVNSRRVTARNGLLIRGGPGAEFPEIGRLRYDQMVHLISRHGEWHMIDLLGDGKCDGFAHGAFLH